MLPLQVPGADGTMAPGPGGLGTGAAGEAGTHTRTMATGKGRKSLWPHSNMTLRDFDKFWDKRGV